jgi:hypothetical protein
MKKIAVLVRVHARMPHALQKSIFLEPCPQHWEIIQFSDLSYMEAPHSFFEGGAFEIIHHLAFPGGGSR